MQQKRAHELIRGKTFYDAGFVKKWLVTVAAAQTYSGSVRRNDGRKERHYNKGMDEKAVDLWKITVKMPGIGKTGCGETQTGP